MRQPLPAGGRLASQRLIAGPLEQFLRGVDQREPLLDAGHSQEPLNLTLPLDDREAMPCRLSLTVGFDQESEPGRVDELELAQADNHKIGAVCDGPIYLL